MASSFSRDGEWTRGAAARDGIDTARSVASRRVLPTTGNMGDAASDPGQRGDFALRHPVGWANAAASASQSGRACGSPATSTDLASGSDGAEHHTIRLLHPRESRAETRCIARQDLNRRAALALQRGRDPLGKVEAVLLPMTWR